MEFHRIYYDLSPTVIGRYPQVQGAHHPCSVHDPRHLGNIWGEAEGTVMVPEAKLARGAKLTDLLSATSIGFDSNLLVSQRLADLFRVSKFYGLQFFTTEVITPKGERHPYEIIHPYEDPLGVIDYAKSSFVYSESTQALDVPVTIESEHDFREKLKRLVPPQIYYVNKLVFADNDLDFFSIRGVREVGGIAYFVSGLLKAEMQEAGITGLVYQHP